MTPFLNFAFESNTSTVKGETADQLFSSTATGTETYRIVFLPDTQGYTKYLPEIFDRQTQWIVDNKDALNIVFVAQLGDVVDEPMNLTQWINGNRSLSVLDGNVAWSVLPGNHDQLNDNLILYNEFFGPDRFSGYNWYGGTYSEGDNANNYETFTAGGTDYLMLNLEYDPSDNVLYWASNVIDVHPDCRVIVSTHDYLMGFQKAGQRSENGERIWHSLVKPHADQVFLVLCGHTGAEDLIADKVDGHIVYQMLADYANQTYFKSGWLRILEFGQNPDQITVKTYSPILNQYKEDPQSKFKLDYNAVITPAVEPKATSNEANTIYIRADDSVDPSKAPIQREGDIYRLTADIYGSIIVERDNTVIDGAGFKLQGTGAQDYRPCEEQFDFSRWNDTNYLMSRPKPPDPYITPESNNTGIYSNAQGLTVRNLQITEFWCGIELEYTEDNTIDHNPIVGNNQGVWIHTASNNTITNNNISDNQKGLTLMTSHDRIEANTFTNTSDCAVGLQWSFNTLKANTITGARNAMRLSSSIRNTFQSNKFSQVDNVFDCSNWRYTNSFQNVESSNMLEQKPVIYLVGKRDQTVPANAGWVALANCSNIVVEDLNLPRGGRILLSETTNSVVANNTISNCTGGISLAYSNGNNVIGNLLADCYSGIHLQVSSNNNVTGNSLTCCSDGIKLDASSNNTVRLNTVEKGGNGVWLVTSTDNLVGSNKLHENNRGVALEGSSFHDSNSKVTFYVSSGNTITGNEVKNNNIGISVKIGKNNLIASNNIENNAAQASVQAYNPPGSSAYFFKNRWDNGTVGNYWGDYTNKYPNIGSAGNIWNNPYKIDDRNQDNHPLTQHATFEVPPQKEANEGIVPLALVLAPIAAFAALGLVGYAFFVKKNRAS